MFSVNTFWFYWYVLIGLQSLIKHQVEDWLKRVHQFLDTWQRRSCSFLLLIIRFERHRLWWKRQCFGDSLKIGWLNSNTCVESFFFLSTTLTASMKRCEIWTWLARMMAADKVSCICSNRFTVLSRELNLFELNFFLYIRKDVLDSL